MVSEMPRAARDPRPHVAAELVGAEHRVVRRRQRRAELGQPVLDVADQRILARQHRREQRDADDADHEQRPDDGAAIGDEAAPGSAHPAQHIAGRSPRARRRGSAWAGVCR